MKASNKFIKLERPQTGRENSKSEGRTNQEAHYYIIIVEGVCTIGGKYKSRRAF